MDYAEKWELSSAAVEALHIILEGLIEKARRTRKIPATYQFWTATDAPEINAELVNAGFMKFEFMDGKQAVYSHEVDVEAMRQALGWITH